MLINCRTGIKITTALFYVIDSNSHNFLSGACAIELDLTCLPRTISDKRTQLQELSVVKEKL